MPINFPRQIGRIRHRRFDLAVLLPNSFRSALLCWLARIGRIAGYDRDGRGWMLTDKLAPARDTDGHLKPVSAIDYYNALAGMLGAKVESRCMSLPFDAVGRAAAEAMLKDAGADPSRPIVMLNPGSAFGPSKAWPADRYAALADALIERRGAQIIINAAPAEKAVAAEVASTMRCQPLINFAGRDNTISLLKGLMPLCSLLVTNDTGARHIAAAMGVGVVTIFGSTGPAWAQIDCPRERIIRVHVDCGPCQRKTCPQPAGPNYHRCMAAITPEMILTAAEELLESTAKQAGEGVG